MRHHGGDLHIAHPADPQGYALAYGFLRQTENEGLTLHHGFTLAREIEAIALAGRADAAWLPAPLLPFVQGRWTATGYATWLVPDREPVLATREPILLQALANATVGFTREYGLGALLAGLRLPDASFEHTAAGPICDALGDGQFSAAVLEPEELAGVNGFHRALPLGAWWRETHGGGERLPSRVLAVRGDLPAEMRGRLLRCVKRALATVREHPGAALAFAVEQAGADDGGGAGGMVRVNGVEDAFGLARDFAQWESEWGKLWKVAAAAGRLPEPDKYSQ